MALDFLSEEAESASNPILNNIPGQPTVIPVTNPYANVLGGFQGNTAPQLYTDSFAPDPDDSIPAQSFSTYFPGMQNDIQKGYYSGSMIGSNPIYAPSALMPYGLIDARQHALKKAADKKAAEQDAFAQKIAGLRAPETQHKAVQPEVTNMFYAGLKEDIAEAQKKYGQSWAKNLWADPNFHQKIQTVKDVAGYEDVAVKHVADVEHMSETGEYALTPAIQQKINEFKTGKYNLLSMSSDPEAQAEARKIFTLGPIKDAVKASKNVAQGIQPDVMEGAPGIDSQGLYDILTSTKIKSTNQQRIKDAVDNSWKSLYGGREELVGIDKNEYYKLVAANFGKEITTTTQTPSTREGSGADEKFDESAIQKEQSSMLVGRQVRDAKGGITNVQASVPARYGYTMKKPVSVKLSGSEEMFDMGDSQGGVIQKAPAGVKDAVIQQFTNVPTVRMPGKKEYVPVDEEGFETAKENGYPVQWELYGIASFQGDEADQFKQKTVLVPADAVKNSVQKTRGKGADAQKTGVDFDKMKVYTDKLNEEVKSAEKQTGDGSKYNIKGRKYSEKELTGMGYTLDQIAQYKEK